MISYIPIKNSVYAIDRAPQKDRAPQNKSLHRDGYTSIINSVYAIDRAP